MIIMSIWNNLFQAPILPFLLTGPVSLICACFIERLFSLMIVQTGMQICECLESGILTGSSKSYCQIVCRRRKRI